MTTSHIDLRNAVLITDKLYIRSDKFLLRGIRYCAKSQQVFDTALSVIMITHATFRCEKTCSQLSQQASIHDKTILFELFALGYVRNVQKIIKINACCEGYRGAILTEFLVFTILSSRGYSQNNWMGVCGTLPKNSYPIYDQNLRFPQSFTSPKKGASPKRTPSSRLEWMRATDNIPDLYDQNGLKPYSLGQQIPMLYPPGLSHGIFVTLPMHKYSNTV